MKKTIKVAPDEYRSIAMTESERELDLLLGDLMAENRRLLDKRWIDLTDDEIEEISDSIEGGDFFDSVFPFARAIEAKLKEKNT